jgi:predicted esterase
MPALLALILALASVVDAVPMHAAWQRYHEAGSPAGRKRAWQELQEAGWPADFTATVQRLRTRTWSSEVPQGILHEERHDSEGQRFPYDVITPQDYDPQRAYPVRVVLHGNARRPAPKPGLYRWRSAEVFRNERMFTVLPTAWDHAMWWSQSQIDNLAAILDTLRARYHIDPDRCYLMGFSDGGTGTWYQSLRAPTPWAAFTPMIGHPWVLGNEEEGAEGDIFAANLAGRALLAVNARDDRLYPAAGLRSYLDLFERMGAEVQFVIKEGGHSVRWWPEEAARFEEFRQAHPRDPIPDHLVWETGDPLDAGRCNWVIVEEIGDAPPPDPDPSNTVLFPDLDPPTRAEAFPRHGPSGRVEVRREGNHVEVHTRNVRHARLLLGVDEFDFSRPLRLTVNGDDSTVEVRPSLAVLMKWAIADGDPSRLFAAEVELDLTRP